MSIRTMSQNKLSTNVYNKTKAMLPTGSVNFTGGYLSLPANSVNAVSTGDFTLEAWIYATAASDTPIFENRSVGTATDGFTLTAYSSSVIRIYSGDVVIASSGTSYLNTWKHVAVVRSSGTWTLYIGGVSQGTSTTSITLSNNNAIIGGGRYTFGSTVSSVFSGKISNARLVKSAVYTANFTPPASRLGAITNTSWLTCQNSDVIVDNGPNALTVTASGSAAAVSANPFQ